MRLLNLLFLLFFVFHGCQSEKSLSKYPNQVGDIAFDEKLDNPNFKRCLSKNKAYQYYNDSKGLQYDGEKIEIIRQLKKLNLASNDNKNEGYITIRFLVNCEGKTGLFRVQQMDKDYSETNFDKSFVEKLLNFTKDLNGWVQKEIRGERIDYYQYLTFKIKDGKVSEVLP